MNRRLALAAQVVAGYDDTIVRSTGKLDSQLPGDGDQGHERRGRVGQAGGSAAALLPARAHDEEQHSRIGNQAGSRVGFFLATGDVGHGHAAMTVRGVESREPPCEAPYATVAVFSDLYGNTRNLLDPTR